MILVVNAGSSSLKVSVFDTDLSEVAEGMISAVGGSGQLALNGTKTPTTTRDHAEALDQMLAALESAGHAFASITAAAHRVVHGGTLFSAPTALTDEAVSGITACIPLAPLHNPANLAAIHALRDRAPDLPQFASFDTAFHTTNPDVATRYAIPKTEATVGIQRYGFHGSSYASMVAHFGADLPESLLALHLGNGASLCAIKNGASVATSMGYSPVSGLTMGTRSGEIDAAAVLKLADTLGPAEADRLLNKHSGLTALAGDNDMKTLLERDDDAARFAVDHFCYWAARHAGSAIVAMGGLDAIAFTGGIGENAVAIREKITKSLSFFGPVPVHVVPAAEEKQIARDALTLMGTV